MPYKKGGAAEQLAKMRRNLKRRAATIERQIARGKFGIDEIGTARAAAESYKKEASTLYASKKVNEKRVLKSETEIQSLLRRGERSLSGVMSVTSKQNRRNLITQTQINRAGTEFSRYSNAEVSRFYRLTQSLWENEKGNRNEIIMRKLGVTDLEIAFERVLQAGNEYAANELLGMGIEVSGEESPEFGENISASDEAGYADNFVGFDISNWLVQIQEGFEFF